ncbi:helix-turn-helix domain-containing protein [Paenibacillus sp. JNUCC31]|uniref:helix-turn-helix domain-containing protein n=1 Tax=Paenibacillus sp. JNUCC-31 TaxID=2777983 RepID=UPI0017845275|nr:helix-turn-helix domain-containing protein [Paenibacillus sp. JNUCC-31]QOS78214.1 helix-turn-helix domain-containing protein [Paenibacillus sp. JNUCC-31]
MRLLIVDDEVIIRTGLASVITWHELGIEILPPAASAEEALTRMADERPHILMTDIRMTGRTGLELAEEGLKLLPELEVIILSGYDDFSYAQQAIRQGVTDYLLKTSKPEEIIKTVLQAKQRITERWAEKSREGQLLRENRQRLFTEWIINGDVESGPCPVFLQQGMNVQSDCYSGKEQIQRQVLILKAAGWSRSSAALLNFAVQNMLEDVLPGAIAHMQKNRIICVVQLPLNKQEFQFTLGIALNRIEQLLKCTLRAAVGLPCREIDHLHESYRTASMAYRYHGLLEDKIWKYEDVMHRKGGKTVLHHEEETTLGTILLDNDSIMLTTWIQELIAELMLDPEVTPESFDACLHSVVNAGQRWLIRTMRAIGREDLERFEPWMPDPDAVVGELRDLLFHHLYGLMYAYHSQMGQGRTTHVQKAIAYMESGLAQDISLQHVAGQVHLHPGHLSELFKKETGVTFGDFVTEMRIRRAMDMLVVSPAKVSEVAAISGYEDVKYFSRLFKKHTGKTPSEYREEALSYKPS